MRASSLLGIEENKPLAPLTTLKVGGPARFFVEVHSEDNLLLAVEYARESGIELFILGGGSNILVSDRGFDGLVCRIGLKGLSISEGNGQAAPLSETVIVTAQAGEDWDKFVQTCVNRGFAGVECPSGIPGLVGATPVQNVGAYGQEVSETIEIVRCLDLQTLEMVELTNEACGFAYRTSIFNSTSRGRYIVLSVTFRLVRDGRPKIAYRELKEVFDGQYPSLAETREAIIRIRAAKSMVIDTADANFRSAGSFFKNPIVPESALEGVARAASVPDVPHFPAGDDLVKIPAAWLIEQAGFRKGFRLGKAGISTNHSLALINCGGATSTEILALKDLIAEGVNARFGIELVPEPIFVGF